MVSLLGLVLIGIPVYFGYSNVSALLRNVQAAKRSGLPYVITRESKLQHLVHKYLSCFSGKCLQSLMDGKFQIYAVNARFAAKSMDRKLVRVSSI
jgi:hypothetical protein